MTSRWLVVLALVACNKPKPPPAKPPEVSICAKVADHLVSLMSGATKHPPEATDPLRRVVETRCDKDAWSAEANQCLMQLTSLADGGRCQAMMTPAQVEAFQRDSEAAMQDLHGQLVEEPPTQAAPPADAATVD
ncbi:MAG TPA: hypothetical protein VFV99_19040 [Kofleriaceae bacterium]|nr:hypothetical protein [Kofleriaceae bacterium]